MEQRLRSRTRGRTGYHYDNGTPYAQNYQDDFYEFFDDIIGFTGGWNKACIHNVGQVEGSLVNYSQLGGRLTGVNLPSVFLDNFAGYDYTSKFDESDHALWSRHLAGSAPDRSEVNLIESFGDLLPGSLKRTRRGIGFGLFSKQEKELARLKRRPPPSYGEVGVAFDKRYPGTGYTSPYGMVQQAAADYISYQFGAAPFIGDAIKLAQLASAFAKRKKELDAARSRGGSKKKWTLGTGSYTDTKKYDDRPLGRYPANMSGTITVSSRHERIAYSSWKPRSDTSIPSTDGQIVQALLGLDAKGLVLGAWELVPWSWLLDYFITFGNYLEATANLVFWDPEGGIIEKTTHTGTHAPISLQFGPQDYSSVTSGTFVWKTFRRTPMPQAPTLTWAGNFLSGHQLSILSALAVLKV